MAVVDVESLLQSSAGQWQERMQRGDLTSVELVDLCLGQISRHNHAGLCLNAMINTVAVEVAHEQAKVLDDERTAGKLRSPMHGIPIILKDIITTERSLGLPTTSGAYAFRDAYGKRNCPLVERLLAAGMIVIGKTNMNEFVRLRDAKPGWSCLGGQTQTPYVAGGKAKDETPIGNTIPSGSSSGSAVGVAAGFAPISIGTETMGSLVHPASRAGLHSLKVTNDRAPKEGVLCLSRFHDSLGAMSKSANDLKSMTEIVLGRDLSLPALTGEGKKPFRVAFVDPKPWRFKNEWCPLPDETWRSLDESWTRTVEKLRAAGMEVTADVNISNQQPKRNDKDVQVIGDAINSEFKDNYADFVSWLDGVAAGTFAEFVAYNTQHAERALPEPCTEQKDCEQVVAREDSAEQAKSNTEFGKEFGRKALDAVLEDHDVLIAPADGSMFWWAAFAGYPIASVPWRTVKFNEAESRPEGLMVVGRADAEDTMLAFILEYEKLFPGRPLPVPLLEGA